MVVMEMVIWDKFKDKSNVYIFKWCFILEPYPDQIIFQFLIW